MSIYYCSNYYNYAGGSNGVVYLWRKGDCIQSANVIKGGVRSMVVSGEMILCGGSGGVLKVSLYIYI